MFILILFLCEPKRIAKYHQGQMKKAGSQAQWEATGSPIMSPPSGELLTWSLFLKPLGITTLLPQLQYCMTLSGCRCHGRGHSLLGCCFPLAPYPPSPEPPLPSCLHLLKKRFFSCFPNTSMPAEVTSPRSPGYAEVHMQTNQTQPDPAGTEPPGPGSRG